jgi:hypothetical protein
MSKNKTQTTSGIELRDRSWSLVNHAHLDYAPKYISESREKNLRASQVNPIDGLIRTPMGYYRLAEDTRDGTRVLLHSYEKRQLQGRRKRGGIFVPDIDNKNYDVYGVTARKGVRGAIFRDDMQHDIRYLERSFQKDLNLHVEEIKISSEDKDSKPRKLIKFANGQVAFSVYEDVNNKWKVRAYNNLRRNWDKTDSFSDSVGDENKGIFAKFLSHGIDVNEFDTYNDALQYVQRYWNTAALRLFKGKELLSDSKDFKTKASTFLLKLKDNKVYRDWGVAIPVGVGVGFVSTLASGVPFIGAAIGLVSGTAWALGAKTVESVISHHVRKIARKKESEEFESLKPYFEKNVIAPYLENNELNQKRFRKKIDPELFQHLRFLNHDEASMNYDDGYYTTAENPIRDFERLSTAPYRYFGAMHDASHYKKGLLTSMFPNGLISLTHVDKDNRITRHYITLKEEFNQIKGDKKHLDSKLERLPGEGPIHKITHRDGQDFRYVSLSEEEFMADLMDKVGNAAKRYRAFGMPLTRLFNVKSAAKITPKDLSANKVKEQPTVVSVS